MKPHTNGKPSGPPTPTRATPSAPRPNASPAKPAGVVPAAAAGGGAVIDLTDDDDSAAKPPGNPAMPNQPSRTAPAPNAAVRPGMNGVRPNQNASLGGGQPRSAPSAPVNRPAAIGLPQPVSTPIFCQSESNQFTGLIQNNERQCKKIKSKLNVMSYLFSKDTLQSFLLPLINLMQEITPCKVLQNLL